MRASMGLSLYEPLSFSLPLHSSSPLPFHSFHSLNFLHPILPSPFLPHSFSSLLPLPFSLTPSPHSSLSLSPSLLLLTPPSPFPPHSLSSLLPLPFPLTPSPHSSLSLSPSLLVPLPLSLFVFLFPPHLLPLFLPPSSPHRDSRKMNYSSTCWRD